MHCASRSRERFLREGPAVHRALSVAVALFFASPHARAEPEPPTAWQSRPFAVNLAGSMWGSPTGVLGVSADYAVLPWFSIAGGAGVGGLITTGPDGGPTPLFALSGRVRSIGDPENAAAAAIGLSTGPYAQGTFCVDCSPDGDTIRTWDWAYWADFSIGYEVRRESGFAFQLNAGVEYLLNSSSDACYQMSGGYGGKNYSPCKSEGPLHHLVFPFLQLSVGYAF